MHYPEHYPEYYPDKPRAVSSAAGRDGGLPTQPRKGRRPLDTGDDPPANDPPHRALGILLAWAGAAVAVLAHHREAPPPSSSAGASDPGGVGDTGQWRPA